ncbi:TadE/TadG family type IV pilus assembly protein [Novosphingobium colocasiae]
MTARLTRKWRVAAHRLRKLRAGEGTGAAGVAIMEFALVLPVLITLGFYGTEIAYMSTINMQISQMATSAADNASRLGQTDNSAVSPTVTAAQVDSVMTGALLQGAAFNFFQPGPDHHFQPRARCINEPRIHSLAALPGKSCQEFLLRRAELRPERSYAERNGCDQSRDPCPADRIGRAHRGGDVRRSVLFLPAVVRERLRPTDRVSSRSRPAGPRRSQHRDDPRQRPIRLHLIAAGRAFVRMVN